MTCTSEENTKSWLIKLFWPSTLGFKNCSSDEFVVKYGLKQGHVVCIVQPDFGTSRTTGNTGTNETGQLHRFEKKMGWGVNSK